MSGLKVAFAALCIASAASGAALAQVQTGGDDHNRQLILGDIDFAVSATGEARSEFLIGVLALHSFWYEEARTHFLKAQKLDPGFGMAYWGEAMTHDNALNTQPGTANEADGEMVVARMDALDAENALRWTPREREFAAAIRKRFAAGVSPDQRRQSYVEAMTAMSRQYPDDEVIAFAALSLMSMPGFDLNNPGHVVAVAGRLEQIYERNPDHPGVLHYLIHVYDTPTFAAMGLRQARRYAEIAPASSHALHMPSHIFRHLGMWDEVAASNKAAYSASVEWQQQTGRPLHMRDYHALDWLMDVYLRLGRREDAARIVAELDAVEAQIRERGEDWGRFPEYAHNLRRAFELEKPSEAAVGHH